MFEHFQKKSIRFEEQIYQNTILNNVILISGEDSMYLVDFFNINTKHSYNLLLFPGDSAFEKLGLLPFFISAHNVN